MRQAGVQEASHLPGALRCPVATPPFDGAAVLGSGVSDVVSVFDAFGVGVYCVDPEGLFTYVNPAGATLLGWGSEELLGRHAHDAVHHRRPDGSPLSREQCSFCAALLNRVSERELDGVFWRKDGSPLPVAHTLAPLHEDGEYVGAIVVFADVSRERRGAALLQAQATRQAAVAELGLEALGGGALQSLLDGAGALVARTLQTEFSAVLALRPDGDGLLLRAGDGWRDGMVGNVTVGPGGDSLSGFAIACDEPVVSEDLRAETRFRAPALLLDHEVLSGVGVVIHGRDHPWGTEAWGALCAYTRLPRTFTADDLNFLHTVANTLALAIERNDAEQELRRRNAEITDLAEQVVQLAEDRNRILIDALDAEDRAGERISQLLHDEVLQSLLTARQDLAKATPTGTANDDIVRRAREALLAAIGELRNAVVALHPVTLERGGLSSAIRAIAHAHAGGAGCDVRVEVAPQTEGGCDQLIVSVAQELMSNVARHAKAGQVIVTLRRVDETLVFDVTDDGRGMDHGRPREALDQGHIGLATIGRRVQAAGGRLEMATSIGKGTRVRVVLPAGAPAESNRRLPR